MRHGTSFSSPPFPYTPFHLESGRAASTSSCSGPDRWRRPDPAPRRRPRQPATLPSASPPTLQVGLLHSSTSVLPHASHVASSLPLLALVGGAGSREAPLRPSLVLFGDSITEQSFRPGGWGAALADTYSRKVRQIQPPSIPSHVPHSRTECFPVPGRRGRQRLRRVQHEMGAVPDPPHLSPGTIGTAGCIHPRLSPHSSVLW
jgi:hypothetical protein